MTVLTRQTAATLMAGVDEQRRLLRGRAREHFERPVRRREYSGTPEEGWSVIREGKHSVRLAQPKSSAQLLEDEVWLLFQRMGFSYMSRDNHCEIAYDSSPSSTRQVDVLCVDDETALIIECKSSEAAVPRKGVFKGEIEALGGMKANLIRSVRSAFSRPRLKVAILFVTRGFIVSEADLKRMDSFGIRHLSEADLNYFRELASHLGPASKYQLHGDLFPGQDIPNMDVRVPAVRGKMGGHTYFVFSIEPEKLLKLGYVLHRSRTIKLIPSYQRLIKRARLNSIRSFVDSGGFFPNSVLVDIDTLGKPLRFDTAGPQESDGIARMGMLHLPPRYRSLYIIDGQHRIFAYSGSPYAQTNSIPVVAFENLERSLQLKLFMEINENQKSVSKNLKNTLDADLKWDSANLKDRADGLMKQIAQDIGEMVSSPLYGRVVVGEDDKTDVKIITLESLIAGLRRTSFIGKFTRDRIVSHGLFNDGNNENTLTRISGLLTSFFRLLSELFPFEWSRSPQDGALLTVNTGVTAAIWLLNDLVELLAAQGKVAPLTDAADRIIKEAEYYLQGLGSFFDGLSFEERKALRRVYGTGGPPRLWREFQRAIHDFRPEFSPPGLAEFWRDQSKAFNLETYSKISDIEELLSDEVRSALEAKYGQHWMKKGLPPKLHEDLTLLSLKKNRDVADGEVEKTPWHCMYIINYRDVVSFGSQWSEMFQHRFTAPGMGSSKKEDRTKWLVRLNKIRNDSTHEHSVSRADAEFVAAVHAWLVDDDPARMIELSRSAVADSAE